MVVIVNAIWGISEKLNKLIKQIQFYIHTPPSLRYHHRCHCHSFVCVILRETLYSVHISFDHFPCHQIHCYKCLVTGSNTVLIVQVNRFIHLLNQVYFRKKTDANSILLIDNPIRLTMARNVVFVFMYWFRSIIKTWQLFMSGCLSSILIHLRKISIVFHARACPHPLNLNVHEFGIFFFG